MVDKDLNEIEVLKKMFPDARIPLCHFHVIKWFRGAVRNDKKFGTYPSEVLKQLDFCVANMVYSKSEDELQGNAEEFRILACRGGREALWVYFDENWLDSKEMWVTYYRMYLPHFRNNTNNRLENFFGKLKVDLDSSFSMKQCLEAVLRYQRRKEEEYVTRVIKPGTKRNVKYGEEMNQLLGMTSEWLADIVETEYDFAVEKGAIRNYSIDDEELCVTLQRDGRVHRVDKFDWMCSYEFSATMNLPCRHAMMYRKHTAGLMAIPYASIPPRWLRVGTLEEELPEVDVPLRITTQGDEVKRKKQMTEQDKYKSVQSVFGRITTELTDLPDGKFSDALEQLEQWWGNLRRGTVGIPSSQGATFDSEILSTQVAAPDKTESEDADVTATEGKGADASPVPVDEPSAVSKSAGDQPESSPKKAAKTTAKSGVSPFNYRAPKLGRPRKDIAAADAKRGAERKEYNNGAKLRTALRGGDVTQVEEFLKSRKPPLVELSSYLNTFETRYRGNNGTKMTVAKRVPEPLCAMYLLPEKIVNTAQMAIEHAIPYGDTMDVSTPPDTSAECWIVDIDGIGVFTQRQLMAMQFILNLSKTCKNGMQCYSWLMSKVDMLFDGEGAASLAERMLNAWPCEDLPGFDAGFDLEWSHLYCAREKCWLHDNFVHAFSTTLAAKYNNNATIFLPLLKMPAPDKEKGKRIPPLTLSALSCAEKDMVFMPMNINSSHWTCLVVDHPKQTVYCYDSLAKRVNQKLLSEMAEELVKRCLPQPYTIATVLSPIQKDSDNCGLFICLYFWRRLFKEAGNDYSKTGLLRRRWDVLRAIVNFSDSSKDAK
ncbi:hypothetical protein PR001_g27552 [Phytophthora rubi]|nr:hypothetical protein PR001_g27552 [Phytophthora rubi]